MLCDECGKVKATVHLTEIINDQITKLNLCEVCAKQKGSDVEQHFGIADLLAALSDVESEPPAQGGVPASKNKCAQCGLTYEDFKKVGRLGCGECYTAFRASLVPLLKRIHGSNQHLGKSPSPSSIKELKLSTKIHEELEAAKQDLLKAVKKEEFEEAAALRDKIKFLEKKIREAKV
ncbi:MAG TPA: UvrB/UvrC motif-containing protein [Candidatus Eisenbacteria bacterium]|jgi:protein arginine kinase activator|nr:UvrB/UvrC motif-containing protein [Candidatus Eisenbacteria bacterium]